MHRSSLYRVCGPAIILGGVALLAAFSLTPAPPESLAAAVDFGLSKFVLANWLFAVGSVVLLGGWIGLTEHLNDHLIEGWSTLGLGGMIVGCVGLALSGAVTAESVPRLLDADLGDRVSNAYYTIQLTMSALMTMSWGLLWIGAAVTGLAIAEDEEYPHRVGYSGLFIAVLELSTQFLKPTSWLHDAFGIVGCLWLVGVGVIFSRIQRTTDGVEQLTAV